MYPVFRKRTTKIGEKSDTKGSFCSTGRFLLLTTSVFLFIYFAPPPPLTCSAIHSSRLFWCELPSFRDIGCRDVCLHSDIMELDGTQRVVVRAPKHI